MGSQQRSAPSSMRYLGLPLHLKKLHRIDFVPLLDKVGGKLPGWNGKLMSKATRVQLVKSVLTAIVTYHATVFPLPKWLIMKIDKLRKKVFPLPKWLIMKIDKLRRISSGRVRTWKVIKVEFA
jgi:hypothetical protein